MEVMHAFRIALAPARDGLTDSQLSDRRRKARSLATANMPSLYTSPAFCVKERLLSDDGHFWLAFDLEVSPQLTLELRQPGKRLSSAATDFIRLSTELSGLKTEALGFSIRVGEMAQMSAVLSRLGDSADELVGQVLNEEGVTWKVAHEHAGKEVSIDFDGHMVTTQLPLIPFHMLETGTRQITCYVESIDQGGMRLTRVNELEGHGAIPPRAVAMPHRIQLHQPYHGTQTAVRDYFLLYIAHRNRLRVSMQVRLALRQHDMTPSHLQLLEIEDRSRLVQVLIEHAEILGELTEQ